MEAGRRLESIDQFRGFAIILMVAANYLAGVESIPTWLKHAPDIGLTIIDLIAPFFIFAVGLTFVLSAQRRFKSEDWRKMAVHLSKRGLALIGLGALITAGENYFDITPLPANWGVLQAIGVATLITILVILLPTYLRLGIGLGLLVGYQALLDRFWLQNVLNSSHGGLPGSLSWAAMLILATVLADLFHATSGPRHQYLIGVLFTLIAGLLLAIWVPVSKNRVSASYVLVSLAASGVMFWVFHHLTNHVKVSLSWLTMWGKNPLILYILHYLFLGVVVLPNVPGWYTQAPFWLIGLQLIVLVVVLSVIGWFFDRKNWIFSL